MCGCTPGQGSWKTLHLHTQRVCLEWGNLRKLNKEESLIMSGNKSLLGFLGVWAGASFMVPDSRLELPQQFLCNPTKYGPTKKRMLFLHN